MVARLRRGQVPPFRTSCISLLPAPRLTEVYNHQDSAYHCIALCGCMTSHMLRFRVTVEPISRLQHDMLQVSI